MDRVGRIIKAEYPISKHRRSTIGFFNTAVLLEAEHNLALSIEHARRAGSDSSTADGINS